jgi:hypothetical protein
MGFISTLSFDNHSSFDRPKDNNQNKKWKQLSFQIVVRRYFSAGTLFVLFIHIMCILIGDAVMLQQNQYV